MVGGHKPSLCGSSRHIDHAYGPLLPLNLGRPIFNIRVSAPLIVETGSHSTETEFEVGVCALDDGFKILNGRSRGRLLRANRRKRK